MKTFKVMFTAVVATVSISFLPGCGDSEKKSSSASTAKKSTAPIKESGHAAHGEGPHGGALADWGGGKFHVEFTVDHNKKQATIYILGSDEKTAVPIKTAQLLLSIASPKIQADLKAVPLDGESNGKSSRFVGTHDNLGIVQEYEGMISGEVDGIPYVGKFKEEPPKD